MLIIHKQELTHTPRRQSTSSTASLARMTHVLPTLTSQTETRSCRHYPTPAGATAYLRNEFDRTAYLRTGDTANGLF